MTKISNPKKNRNAKAIRKSQESFARKGCSRMDLVQESCRQVAQCASQAEREIRETAQDLRKSLEEQRAITKNVMQLLSRLMSSVVTDAETKE